jgi:hypothetical protein
VALQGRGLGERFVGPVWFFDRILALKGRRGKGGDGVLDCWVGTASHGWGVVLYGDFADVLERGFAG